MNAAMMSDTSSSTEQFGVSTPPPPILSKIRTFASCAPGLTEAETLPLRKLLAGLALVGLTSSMLLAASMTRHRTTTLPFISETQAEVQLDSGFFSPVDYEAALNPTTSLSPHDGSADVSMEKDVAYTGATQFVWRNVLIPAECLARCRNDARCRVWVLDTQSYECSLKWVEPNERVQKVSKPGSVSGLPFQWNKPHSIFCYAVMRPGTYEQGTAMGLRSDSCKTWAPEISVGIGGV
eukprot:s42_g13.t1